VTEDEALRRRLYRPGADEADVAAYLTRVAGAEAGARSSAAAPRTEPPRPARRRGWVAATAAVLVAAGVAILLHGRGLPEPTATPLPTARVTVAEAARYVAALDAGDDAGLGPSRAGPTPYLEAHGVGDGTVPLPVAASGGGGRLRVLLVTDRDGTAGWATARLVIHDDRTIHLRTEASASGALRAGVPAEARVVYAAEHRPLRLLVRAPAHVRWGVAVVFGS
jgi:hypothetical protein